MSDEEHSDSEFYYPEEQETAERNARRRDRHFDKAEANGNTRYEKLVPVVLILVLVRYSILSKNSILGFVDTDTLSF